MVATQISKSSGLKCCAYYRMSSDEQTDSIDQQQKECRAHAQRMGWVIVAEYIDRGKSGSKDIEKRTDFHRMLADASRGEWAAILCWDSSRFGRLDMQQSAGCKLTLRKAGVHLETVREGRIDWNTSMGRLQDALLSESNHEYSVKLSANTVRGREATMQRGFWPFGSVPFGYDKQYFDGSEAKMLVKRAENFSKPRNWKLKLAVNADESQIVKTVFEQFANRDVSLRGIAWELSKQHLPTPQGGDGGWTKDTVRDVLINPAYCGDVSAGHHRRKRAKTAFTRMADGKMNDACPAIIDRSTWNVVQEKLQQRRDTGPAGSFR